MKVTKQNIENFSVIDEIHAGFIERPNSAKLVQAVEKAGGELALKPINLIKADMQKQLVLKCKHSGNTYSINA
ncbi:hypothetical protein [Thiomicrorhabdus sp. 6S3-12]|uniref:hypothetical protein n=1 Tax=Thiomicrorhabdus sp. 6S3-12 TaxID=2819681 RepID=UPI001AAD8E1D|nr:hypothetical protein [Thiomicrorhabdus sp. 6S3-12]MBO1923541.1 hypothetical protein [Thiomicrorhabdus sp. 6S3-12]